MPRQSHPVDDETPLDAPRLDVAARVGWLLRTHRTVAEVSLRQMAESLAEQGVQISAATLSRVESEGHRTPALIDGYGAALGLPRLQLRAGIDGICRAFSYAPPKPPEPLQQTLDTFSRACEAVAAAHPTGGDWIEFARHHTMPGGFGLPTTLMEPLVARLIDETSRSVTGGRFVRREALTVLASSAYGDLTLQAVSGAVEDLGHQTFWYDLTSVLSDYPSLPLARRAVRLLASPSAFHALGGSFVLQGMLVRGGMQLAEWSSLVPDLHSAAEAARGDEEHSATVQQVLSSLPPGIQQEIRARGTEIRPKRSPVTYSRSRGNAHYALATELARATTRRLGHPDEPLLARLVFEACFELRGVRMSMATCTLAASPFAADLAAVIVQRPTWPDPARRAAALRVAAAINPGGPVEGAERLLTLDDPAYVAMVTLIGRSGGTLPDEALARGLAGDETSQRATVYCLGMAGDPRLAELADDAAQSETVRVAARWWLDVGPRVVE